MQIGKEGSKGTVLYASFWCREHPTKINPYLTAGVGIIWKMARSCERCQSIDPLPITHEKGELHVDKN